MKTTGYSNIDMHTSIKKILKKYFKICLSNFDKLVLKLFFKYIFS